MSTTYPKPLYQRAVNAYLQLFRDKHNLDDEDIAPVGVPEYPTYLIKPWHAVIQFDDIRLDIDGLDYNSRHIAAPKNALYEHVCETSDAYYKGEHTVNYRTYLLNLPKS